MRFIENKISVKYVLILFLISFLSATNAYTQSLDSIRALWKRAELARAKEEADLFVSAHAYNPEGWLLRAKIYSDISKHPVFRSLIADGRGEALQSISNALRINNDFTRNDLSKTDFQLISDISDGYRQEGIAYYNAGIENQQLNNYLKAFELFKKAEAAGNMCSGSNSRNKQLDINLLYYIAVSAIFAEKDAEAEYYAKKLVDDTGHVSVTNNTELIYQWLVYNCRKQNNAEELAIYTAISNQKFPGSDYFDLNYIEFLRGTKQYVRLLDQYADLFARGFRTRENLYSYIHDLFCTIYDKKDSITAKEALKQKLTAELTHYVQEYPQDLNAKLLFAKYLINQSAELQNDFRSQNKPTKKIAGPTRKRILQNLNGSNEFLQWIVDNARDTAEKNDPVYKEAIALLKANQKYINSI